jgi:Fe-S-cluster containining protein
MNLPKSCGDCTACCGPYSLSVPGVFEAFKRCPHAEVSCCGVYETRPEGCREFQCLWSRHTEWGARLRPNRCGFVGHLRETTAPHHFSVVFSETVEGVDPMLLRTALRLVLEICREVKATRLTLNLMAQDQQPRPEVDAPYGQASQAPDEAIVMSVVRLWKAW